jgi:nicotinamidase-related amidase
VADNDDLVGAEWLVVVDCQRAFGDRTSPWYTPGFEDMARNIARLLPIFTDRTVFTRFIPPADPVGSWKDYYSKWPFAQSSKAAPRWELVEPMVGSVTVDCPTFSKWGPALKTALGGDHRIVLCGVSTDCCVLGTAFAAIDDGATVRVVTDACTAEPALHQHALGLLARRAPQVVLVTTEEEVGRASTPQSTTA